MPRKFCLEIAWGMASSGHCLWKWMHGFVISLVSTLTIAGDLASTLFSARKCLAFGDLIIQLRTALSDLLFEFLLIFFSCCTTSFIVWRGTNCTLDLQIMQTKSNQINFSIVYCLSESNQCNICLTGMIAVCTAATAHTLFGKCGWLKSVK